MIVKLLTERHLEFLSITGGCRSPSESTLVKMSNCWKSRALAHLLLLSHTHLAVFAEHSGAIGRALDWGSKGC